MVWKNLILDTLFYFVVFFINTQNFEKSQQVDEIKLKIYSS